MNIPKTTFNFDIHDGLKEYDEELYYNLLEVKAQLEAEEAKRHRLLKLINKLEEKLLEIFFYRNSLMLYVIYLFSRETNEPEETYYDRTGN